MANPTTNYGFVLPTPTDLVTDLPADFEVALQGVDTQMKTNADAAIAKTIVDAKGDIIAATGADTVSRLAVGANNTILTADSTTATGLKWSALSAGGMTQLATGTLSGSTTVISTISGAYRDLILRVFNYVPASTGGLNLQFNGDSTSKYTSIYYSSSGENTTFGSNYTRLSEDASSSATNGYINSTIFEYANTVSRKLMTTLSITEETASPVFNLIGFNGSYNSTSAITSITLLPNTGSFTSGTYYLYGVN
jgi:hypothetical protein